MRLIIDLQGAQGSSRHRGIGRYCLSLTQGLARNCGDHEIFVALSGLFPDTIEPIRAALQGLIPHDNILVWHTPAPVRYEPRQNDARRRAGELLRETVLASVSPDFVLVGSMVEGLGEDIVTSVAHLASEVPTAAILYDLIPLIYRDQYLPDPAVEAWYENKLGHLRNADLLLAISESARLEAMAHLGADPQDTINISTAADEHFTAAPVDAQTRAYLEQRYGLVRPFVMYTGGIDHRKNIEGLISAFARLPAAIRGAHQLAIVCSIADAERDRLRQVAQRLGLAPDDLILTGFIPENDLLACYRACKLFVFPSWHEGFGLPALEAMQCGRAVIASNTSSLPEVIGLDEALFDASDVDAISRKIAEVLADDHLRTRLEQHGLTQAKKFSWDETARRAWSALEASHTRIVAAKTAQRPARRPRLAFLSPLPPEPSGISDYSAELLPELARHYRIEIISAQESITDAWVLGNCLVRSVAWFRRHAHEFDRILYHFGNSHFHTHMFDLLRDHPGVVVLHDFFLSAIVAHRDEAGISPNAWPRALLDAHGWPAVIDRFKAEDPTNVVWSYPCNLQVLQDALGVIVHSEYPKHLARRWYGDDAAAGWSVVNLLRQPVLTSDRVQARRRLGVHANEFVVCSFGLLGPTKMNHRLLDAWLASPLAADPRCHLVFVGQNDNGDYGIALDDAIRAADSAGRIRITGRADAATFRRWLAAADLGVQLRTLSRGETSAAVLDCMNYGMATIANANGSMADLPKDTVVLLGDDFSQDDLVAALTSLWRGETPRRSVGESARDHIAQHHRPRRCAEGYANAIEHFYTAANVSEYGLGEALQQADLPLNEAEWADLAGCVATIMPPAPRHRRLLVDISELVRHDSRSGIQRVVRSVLWHWLHEPPAGWIVEPVYAKPEKAGYRYARGFASRFLAIPGGWGEDDRVEPRRGDIFIGLDLQPDIVPEQEAVLAAWRRIGVIVKFVVYDLLPIKRPEFFLPGDPGRHERWLRTVAGFDGVICISRATADDFHQWLKRDCPERALSLAIDWFHLGADTENSVPTRGLPDSAKATLAALRAAPSFLAVGTLEPRKSQRQILAAFETLWAKGIHANLILVGKLGWKMEDFVGHLRDHPHFGRRLFWLEAISDEYLDLIYAASRHLIAASAGEGFGLPLIEAHRHGLPILARDIPVFREVAGDGATYFADSTDPAVISAAIRDLLRPEGIAAKPPPRAWQSWAQSAQTLLRYVLGQDEPYLSWASNDTVHPGHGTNETVSDQTHGCGRERDAYAHADAAIGRVETAS